MDTAEYAPGRLVDVWDHDAPRTALMWHGAQTDARATMGPLAERLAGHGFVVMVPDWNSNADDRGRADLLRSLEFARSRSADPDALVLVGWSLGGLAAAGATLHADQLGVRFAHTVCLAGAFVVADPVSGEPLPTDLTGLTRSPFTLLHGIGDHVVPVTISRDFAETLRANEWPVELVELDTDHAAIAGAAHDPLADRYIPAEDPQALQVATGVAARIAAAAS
ncbi:alpha/beta fold hydrolase [Mycolicibacterium pulveris]|nr:alpha/beta fold hydrolase [Mycolicibacterium pulveris]MCV6983613.1 alpha/beta fold hydrolase [Mycolicibacterium pulveris]